jgi:hypothetical protein
MKWLPLALTVTMPIWIAPMLYLLALLFGYQDPYYKYRQPHSVDQTKRESIQPASPNGANP